MKIGKVVTQQHTALTLPTCQKKKWKSFETVVCEGVSSFSSHCLYSGLKRSSVHVMWEHRKVGSAT